MDLGRFLDWTKSKLSRSADGDVPVTSSDTHDALTAGPVAVPALDLFENQSEFRLVADVPGATTRNTHVSWDGVDSLSVHVQRAVFSPDAPWVREYQEADWYLEIALSPSVDATKAASSVRDGVVTISLPKRRTAMSTLVPVRAG